MAEPKEDVIEVIDRLVKNSQASTALVTLAIVDEWLQKLLLFRMRTLSNAISARIFDSNEPLYNLSAKIDIAYAFELIDQDTLTSLRVLKDIRNEFAHTQVPLHFGSPEIKELCKKLPKWKNGTHNRELFESVAVDCVKKIDAASQRFQLAKALMEPDASKSNK